MRKNYEEISLQSDVFEAARKDFDRLLQKLFRTMENNESKEGSITLKVNVQTEKTPAWDEHGVYFEAHKPTIEHVITTTVPLKDKANGKKNTGMKLVWDGELGRYILRYVPEEGQRSMFDDDFEENLKNESPGITETAPELPDHHGAIDADFREIPDDDDYEYEE